MKIHPYLSLDGTTEEAMAFYAGVFGREPDMMMRFRDMPDADQFPPEILDLIAHARIDIGGTQLMASDNAECFAGPHKGIEGISVNVEVDEPGDARTLFEKLSDGGTVTMAMDSTSWARAFGACRDQFGVSWMVNCE